MYYYDGYNYYDRTTCRGGCIAAIVIISAIFVILILGAVISTIFRRRQGERAQQNATRVTYYNTSTGLPYYGEHCAPYPPQYPSTGPPPYRY